MTVTFEEFSPTHDFFDYTGCCELYSAIHCRAVATNSLARGRGEFFRLPFRKAWCSFRAAMHGSGRSLGPAPQ